MLLFIITLFFITLNILLKVLKNDNILNQKKYILKESIFNNFGLSS